MNDIKYFIDFRNVHDKINQWNVKQDQEKFKITIDKLLFSQELINKYLLKSNSRCYKISAIIALKLLPFENFIELLNFIHYKNSKKEYINQTNTFICQQTLQIICYAFICKYNQFLTKMKIHNSCAIEIKNKYTNINNLKALIHDIAPNDDSEFIKICKLFIIDDIKTIDYSMIFNRIYNLFNDSIVSYETSIMVLKEIMNTCSDEFKQSYELEIKKFKKDVKDKEVIVKKYINEFNSIMIDHFKMEFDLLIK